MHIKEEVNMCVCLYVCMCVRIYIYTHTLCVCIYAYTQTHISARQEHIWNGLVSVHIKEEVNACLVHLTQCVQHLGGALLSRRLCMYVCMYVCVCTCVWI
jgi:hypothetical protein